MSGVPSNIIVPFVGVEFDNTRALPTAPGVPIQGLIIGQKKTGTSIPAETLTLVTSADEVGNIAGFGSDLHLQAKKWFAENSTTPTYIIALADAATSTAATQTIDITGAATEVGEVDLYINGNRIAVGVAVGDDADTVGAALVTAINAELDLPVTAAYAANILTLTLQNAGVAAGDVDVRFNYNTGEKIPAGLVVALNTYTAGTVDPDIQDAIDAIGDNWFQVIVGSLGDSTNLTAMQNFLADQAGPLIQRDSMYYFAKKDTLANLITFSTDSARNSQFIAMIDAYNRPNNLGESAAAYAGAVAQSVLSDPAVPLHRMTLSSLSIIAEEDRRTLTERNQLATNGVATCTDGNGVQTESTVTMYLKNSADVPDTSYQFQNTIYILQRLRYTFVSWILSRYPRAKLADSLDGIGSGQQVMTPDVGKAEAVAWFRNEQRAGQVENIEQFKTELVVERDATNVNRMNWLLPPDLINQFIVGSGVMQFRLQS